MEYASEIHRLLGLGDDGQIGTHNAPGTPVSLPVEHSHEPIAHESKHEEAPYMNVMPEIPSIKSSSTLKNFLVYPLIFVIAFGFFYVLLNFSAIWAQIEGFFTRPQDEVILQEDLSGYYAWIGGYYFAVGDNQLLEPNNDIDKDGLSNIDEFTMRTNPTLADSDSDGFSDGVEVINNYNPWGLGLMTDVQKKLAEGLNSVVINNRITYNASETLQSRNGTVLGANTTNYNLGTPGRLSIPRLNIQVPIVWSTDPANFDQDLTHGVIHYPGTALPGEQGTIYISGHSSDYFWKNHPYKQVFAKLNYLTAGDDIFIDVYGMDGKTYNYRYQVTVNKVYSPDDQTQFIDNSSKKLNLSTCWPIGTQKDRLVVSAVQVNL